MQIQEIEEIWKMKHTRKEVIDTKGNKYCCEWNTYKVGNKTKGQIDFKKDGTFVTYTSSGVGKEFNTIEQGVEWLKMLNQPLPITIKGVIYIKKIKITI